MVFLFVILIIILLLIFSKIRIQIENFRFSSIIDRHINEDYKIIIQLCILGKIPIVQIKITRTKLEKLKIKEKMKKVDINALKNNKEFDKKILKAIKETKILINRMNFKIELGTEDAVLTSIIIPIISTLITFLLRNRIKEYKCQTFIIQPIYINQNLINIAFSGIFEIKMIHIINIIYILNKKEGEDKNERTSNRGAYDYSYE